MRGKDHAGIHTGRNDRNSRPRGSRRRTSLERFVWSPADAETEADEAAWKAAHVERIKALWAEAEAGYEGVDGLHSDEAPKA